VDLVLTDIRMGAVDGLTVLREFKHMNPDTAVVVLTSFGSLEGAIEAIKQEAYDYLAKPFKKEDITLVGKRSLDHCRLVRENTRFREELKSKDEWSPLVGSSLAMLTVYKLVARVTESKSTVLLLRGKRDRQRVDCAGHSCEWAPSGQAIHTGKLRSVAGHIAGVGNVRV
jgi:two-component system, NtrC family, response regulator AtoC